MPWWELSSLRRYRSFRIKTATATVLHLQSIGRRELRPIDRLVAYKEALVKGGTRCLIYETIMNRAEKNHRIPQDAAAVLDEIIARLKEGLKESLLQGQMRLLPERRLVCRRPLRKISRHLSKVGLLMLPKAAQTSSFAVDNRPSFVSKVR